MEVKLNKNGWHRKLQRWTFGDDVFEFNNLCPFFWLTVFCLLISPITVSFSVTKLVVSLFGICYDYLDRRIFEPMFDRWLYRRIDRMTDEEAWNIYREYLLNRDGWSAFYAYETVNVLPALYGNRTYKKFHLWRNKAGDSWRERIFAFYTRERDFREAERTRLAALKERRARTFGLITHYTKYLFYLAVGVAAAYGLYFVALFVWWLSEVFPEINFTVLWIVLGLLFGTSLLILVGNYAFNYLGMTKFAGKVGRAMSNFIDFFVMYVKAAKKEYCPSIKWEGDE